MVDLNPHSTEFGGSGVFDIDRHDTAESETAGFDAVVTSDLADTDGPETTDPSNHTDGPETSDPSNDTSDLPASDPSNDTSDLPASDLFADSGILATSAISEDVRLYGPSSVAAEAAITSGRRKPLAAAISDDSKGWPEYFRRTMLFLLGLLVLASAFLAYRSQSSNDDVATSLTEDSDELAQTGILLSPSVTEPGATAEASEESEEPVDSNNESDLEGRRGQIASSATTSTTTVSSTDGAPKSTRRSSTTTTTTSSTQASQTTTVTPSSTSTATVSTVTNAPTTRQTTTAKPTTTTTRKPTTTQPTTTRKPTTTQPTTTLRPTTTTTAPPLPGPQKLTDGGFGSYSVARGTYAFVSPVGWSSSSGQLEIWGTGHNNVTSAGGNHHAELNGNGPDTIWQNVSVTPGATYTWGLSHRGRKNTDTIKVRVDGELVGQLSTRQGSWKSYSGTVVVPRGKRTVKFEIEAVDSGSSANLLDEVTFRRTANP